MKLLGAHQILVKTGNYLNCCDNHIEIRVIHVSIEFFEFCPEHWFIKMKFFLKHFFSNV